MRKKRGQLQSHVFLYILLVIIIAFTLIFGFLQVKKIFSQSEQQSLQQLAISMQRDFETYSSGPLGSYGSVKDRVYAVPGDVQTVCFVDDKQEIDALVNPELSARIADFPGFNIYLFPFSEYAPLQAGSFSLPSSTNPLCVNAVNGELRLRLTSGEGKVELSPLAFKDLSVSCSTVLKHGDPADKIDAVFLAYNYANKEDFQQDVQFYVDNAFGAVEPFASRFESFNFYRIDSFQDLGCETKQWIDCNSFRLTQMASNCPHDFIFLLMDRNKAANLLDPVRSSAIGNVVKINTANSNYEILHEFAHALGKLADEYVDDTYYSQPALNFREEGYPNCDGSGCNEWQGVSGTGCFEGCSLSAYYRPTQDSLMRSYKTDRFGPVNNLELLKKLDEYGGEE